MSKLVRLLIVLGLGASCYAQTTQTYTGTIKDLTGQVVTSGQVTFTTSLVTTSTIPGTGVFVPTTVTCNINTDGSLSGFVGGVVSGACIMTPTISLSPSGLAYKICIQPYFNTPGACFFDYALGGTKDISSIAPTLPTGPINFGGVQGPPIPFLGTWNSATTYQIGQAVAFNNAVYISLQNPNLNQTPSSSPSFWSVMLSPASLVASPTTNQTVTQPAHTGFTVNTLVANGINNPNALPAADFGAQINTLVAACGGSFCPIFIPPGSYSFTTPIVLASNVELYGAGEYQTILNYTAAVPGPGGPTHIALITTAITAGAGTTNVKIHDLQINGTVETLGNAATYNNTAAISLAGTNGTIDKVKAAHFWAFGGTVNLAGSHNTISNSDVEYGTFPIAFQGSFQSVVNNYASNHYSTASSFEAPGVHYWDCIALEGSGGSLVQGNFVEDCGQSGIYFGANGHVTTDPRIIGNKVLHAWNRGLDGGVTGDVTPSNAVIGAVASGNTVTDSAHDNIWFICNQRSVISGNTSLYTTNYPTFFGSSDMARSGIAVADICFATLLTQTVADNSSYVSVSGNSALDSTGTAFAGVAFNVQNANSIGNSFFANPTNGANFTSTGANMTLNTFQQQNHIPASITNQTAFVSNTGTPLSVCFDAAHCMGFVVDASGNAFLNDLTATYNFQAVGGGSSLFTIAPAGITSVVNATAPKFNATSKFQIGGTDGAATVMSITGCTLTFVGGILTAHSGASCP